MNAFNIAWLRKRKRCLYPKCRKQFEGLISIEGKYGEEVVCRPNEEFLFHYYDTHGFPPELTIEKIHGLLSEPMSKEEVDHYNQTIKEETVKVKK